MWVKLLSFFIESIEVSVNLARNCTTYMAKSMTLRNIPKDVFKILLDEQKEEKVRRGKGMYGIEQTIYKIVRDYERCKREEKK